MINELELARQLHHEGKLTDEQFEALRLSLQGAGYNRIGLILNLSRDGARGRVQRARRILDSHAIRCVI